MTTPGWYARGPKGTSISTGTGAPSGGNDGDVYIRTSNGDVYSKASGTWSVVGNIRGPIGATPTLTDLGITADATELNYVDGVTSSIQTQLNGKQATLGFTPENSANKGAANGYASLDSGGKLTAAQVPDIALVQFLGTVANQTAMLALTGQIGDWCIRSDTSTVFILNGNSPSTLGNWTQMVYPAAPVASVAGKTGAVTLVKADVGLGSVDNTADSAKNVLSASKLTTARNIDGQSFDGSADVTVIAPGTHAATSKATPVDADELPLSDSAASFGLKKLTWANLKATIKTYLDGTGIAKLTTARTINGVAFDGTANITVADSTKEPAITAGTAAQYWRGDKTMQTLDKTAVGLGNVTNNPQYYPGGTDVAVADGGTGASTASAARTNLGLGSLATVTPTGTPDGTKFLRDDGSWQAAAGGGGGGGGLTPVGMKSANYTANANELIECDTSGGTFTVTLPNAPANGSAVVVHFALADYGPVTIAAAGSDKFFLAALGITSFTLGEGGDAPASSIDLVYRSGVWEMARYTPIIPSAASVSVTSYGAKGDGTTDDTAAINAAVAASPAGSTIFFPAGTYLISAPIVLLPNRSYVGAGTAFGSASVIKQKNSANITNGANPAGLLVSSAWNTNATTCDNPIVIENLCIDGNKANNATSTACGIVLTNYWSHVRNCAIFNTPKDGVRLTDVTKNGSNTVTNSCSENTVRSCKFDSIGGDAIRGVSNNGNSNMDGFCVDNLISTVTGNGILLDKASGWVIRRNHLYGIGVSGIDLSKAFATLVEGNYIEDFGLQASNGVWYSGITLTQLDGRGSQVVNNFVGCAETSSSVGAYIYLLAKAGASQTDAQMVVSGNLIHGPSSPTNKGTGLYFDVASGGVLKVYDVANDVRKVNTPRQSYTGVELQATDRTRAVSTASSATPSINADATDLYSITALAAPITSVTITGTPTDGQKLLLRIKDNGTARALAFGSGIIASGAATLPTTTVAGKTHHIGLTYDAVAAKWVALAVDSTGY